MQKFSQKVFRIAGDWCVEVPPAVTAVLGNGRVQVSGTINGIPILATLAPQGNDRQRLYITEKMKRDTGVKVGDLIQVSLELDSETHDEDIIPELDAALAGRPVAKARFNALPLSHKRQILRYLDSIKAEDALRENIEKLLVKMETG